jgi:hypothetical protein
MATPSTIKHLNIVGATREASQATPYVDILPPGDARFEPLPTPDAAAALGVYVATAVTVPTTVQALTPAIVRSLRAVVRARSAEPAYGRVGLHVGDTWRLPNQFDLLSSTTWTVARRLVTSPTTRLARSSPGHTCAAPCARADRHVRLLRPGHVRRLRRWRAVVRGVRRGNLQEMRRH